MYLLPQPEKAVWQDGKFFLRYKAGIVIDTRICGAESAYVYEYAKLLQQEIEADTGFTLGIRREKATADGGDIFLTCDTEKMSADKAAMEAYSLQISETGVRTPAGAPAGIHSTRPEKSSADPGST